MKTHLATPQSIYGDPRPMCASNSDLTTNDRSLVTCQRCAKVTDGELMLRSVGVGMADLTQIKMTNDRDGMRRYIDLHPEHFAGLHPTEAPTLP